MINNYEYYMIYYYYSKDDDEDFLYPEMFENTKIISNTHTTTSSEQP